MNFRSTFPLWLLWLVPLLLWALVVAESRRRAIARRFVSERLRGLSNPLRPARPWLLAIAVATSLVALAGPLAGFVSMPIVARDTNRVIVIDVSYSMAAEDVGTSRLSAAKAIATRLAMAQEGRTALVVFEGLPEVVSPLTTDAQAVASLVDTLQPGELGEPGSDVGGAVQAALQLLESDPGRRGDVVVISDGEDQRGRVDEAIAMAKPRGTSISSILVGTERGSTIPTPRGPLRNESDEVVTTRADRTELQKLASGTDGLLLHNPFGAASLDPLLSRQRDGSERATTARVPVDRYQWPLGFAFVLLLGAAVAHRGGE